MRRGLCGELLRQLHIQSHRYAVFCLVAHAVLAACLAAFVWLARRSHLFSSALGGPLTALFLGSYAITCLADLVGYLDPLLIALAMLAIGVREPRAQL